MGKQRSFAVNFDYIKTLLRLEEEGIYEYQTRKGLIHARPLKGKEVLVQVSPHQKVNIFYDNETNLREAIKKLKKLIVDEDGEPCKWIQTYGQPSAIELSKKITAPISRTAKRKLMLEHSRILLNDPERFNIDNFLSPYFYARSTQEECIIQHLCSGYRELYQKVLRVRKMAEKLPSVISSFERELELKVSKILNSALDSPSKAAEVIYEDLRSAVRKSTGRLSSLIEVVNIGHAVLGDPNVGFLKCQDRSLGLGDLKKCRTLRKFVETETNSRENLKKCKKIVNFEEKYHMLFNEVKYEWQSISDKVKHGTPLRGRCDLCP